jgi:hypothetical protein
MKQKGDSKERFMCLFSSYMVNQWTYIWKISTKLIEEWVSEYPWDLKAQEKTSQQKFKSTVHKGNAGKLKLRTFVSKAPKTKIKGSWQKERLYLQRREYVFIIISIVTRD